MERHRVKAGLTGWAQVSGYRGDSSIERRLQADLYYIRNWSFTFDIRIMLLTLVRVLSGRNAH
nr:sugar transferase [Spirochaetota bacterium]